MSSYRKDYSMADDKIYSKYGKIVTMMDDLQSAGCFDGTYSQPVFRLVVTGPNGSGKDSFINSILGYPFLPPNCRSKRQMEIRILHSTEDVSPMVQIEEIKKSFTHHNECARNIADIQKAANDTNLNMPIRMNFTTNTSADLYITSTCEDDSRNPYAKTLIREALAPSNNFIILVMEAMTLGDERTQLRDQWFNLIRTYDPELTRTVVVLTKCDILPNNFNYNRLKNFLRPSNEIFSPKYGFICVKTNFASHLESSDQSRLEREYFCNHKVFQFLPINDYFTIDTVGEKITKWIWQTNEFRKNLIFAYSKLQERLKFIEDELKIYGNEVNFELQSKELYLQSMLMVFCDTVEKTFSGKCEDEEYNLSNTKLNKLYFDFLCTFIDYKPSTTFNNTEIIETIQRSEGGGLSGFPSGEVIYILLDKAMEDLRNKLSDYFDNVYTTVNQLFKSIINRYFSRFPKALHSIEELILSFFDQEFNKTRELTTNLAEMNFTYLYVDELSETYKTLIDNNLLKRGGNANNPNNMNNPNQLDNTNNFQFKENKDISFFKAIKDKDSYYQGLADYVKALVDYIYAEIIRSLREYIPKSTGNFFIKSLKKNMRYYLLQFISKNVEFSQEFEEDQEDAQKRKYYIESQKKLKKINKDIGVDDQITKIVKEDNIKTIDNILQSQGINTQNINEIEKEVGNQSAKNLSYKPKEVNTNLFGVPPKKETTNKNTTTVGQSKASLNTSTKTNLFGPPTTQTNTNPKLAQSTRPTNNLFGNPTTTQKKPNPPATNNLFGNPTTTKKNQTNNLFGTPNQSQQRTNNLFGNPSNTQQNKNKDMNISLKVDPKQGTITGVNAQNVNVDPKDAYNFYQKNKQYLPSGQQMASGAQKGIQFYNQTNANNNTNTKNTKSSGLANLFGTGKK